MRWDMFHVIIDRPRTHGNGGKSDEPKGYRKALERALLNEDWDRLVKFESSARWRRYGAGFGAKWLNEHLRPLVRYLEKQVGRPWNDVFSEICEHISQNSAVQSHVRDHVWDTVERHVVIVDGVPCSYHPPWRWGGRLRAITHGLYVDPRTGILWRAPQETLKPRESKKRTFVTKEDDVNIQYHKLAGGWFEVHVKRISTSARTYCRRNDSVLMRPVCAISPESAHDTYGARDLYGHRMRRLRRSVVRRLRLNQRLGQQ